MTSFAANGGGANWDYMYGVAVDSAGAAVAVGSFFGSATFGGVALTGDGGNDAFLWKLSAEGTTLWVARSDSTSSEQLQAVAVDSADAVVAAGMFFTAGAFGGYSLTGAGGSDAFLWKLNAEGTTLWALRGGGTSSDYLYGVAVDSSNAVVAAGYFSSTSVTFGAVTLTRTGYGDAVVWKVSGEGTTLWAVRGGGTSYSYMKAVAVDGAGAVVAAGYISSSTATFGGVVLTTAGSYDAILWKLNAQGTTLWAVRGGGTSTDELWGVAVDGAGAVVAAGYIKSSQATFGGVTLTNAQNNAILWKVSAEGTTLWAERGGGGGTAGASPSGRRLTGHGSVRFDVMRSVAFDNANSVVAAGSLSNPRATFGAEVLTKAGTGTGSTNDDAVLWKVSAEGTTLWAMRAGGTDSNDKLYGVAVDGMGAVVAAGYFTGSLTTYDGEALTNAGGTYGPDAVLWKVSVDAKFKH